MTSRVQDASLAAKDTEQHRLVRILQAQTITRTRVWTLCIASLGALLSLSAFAFAHQLYPHPSAAIFASTAVTIVLETSLTLATVYTPGTVDSRPIMVATVRVVMLVVWLRTSQAALVAALTSSAVALVVAGPLVFGIVCALTASQLAGFRKDLLSLTSL
ncbi:hypothetical protein SDRG_10331 [Saprolegnia diclina VS20]|uniref:Uncharacterized protein n=1 Tax=Saprolegnia diclina (strain VS20) TaxID=1156394 RepID=T0QEW9_SAPDV|nr:hypothetical protein SDRG_10331 [Saprolegnia diclina VS20]EQC32135.1 hypothetical protein SDRG_10331 [Saprolegnia diclina VS20]|eukprot:XP_008614537.1 hypothetical protein SDRG_10331 [Saprolegnia diclina VS20]